MRYWLLCLFVGVLNFVLLEGARSLGAEPDPVKGRTVYEKNCMLCHGPNGRGDGPLGMSLNPPAAYFFSPESRNKSDEEWMKAIREGHSNTAMTEWKGKLSEKDIQDVTAYVRKLSGEPEECC